MLRRRPRPALRPFVALVWAAEPPAPCGVPGGRERVLATGAMHVCFRLSGGPLRVFDGDAVAAGRVVGRAVVGGARAVPYVKDVSAPAASVGAVLRPGGSEALFGIPARELSGEHVALEDVLGEAAREAEERLLDARGCEARLARLENALEIWMAGPRTLHPAVRHALGRIDEVAGVDKAPGIGALVAESGLSHRRFIDLFTGHVGLAPKRYARVRRFQRALHRLADGHASTADVAFMEGYSDQAHLTRDFRAFTGVTPGAYRRARPASPNHLLVGR